MYAIYSKVRLKGTHRDHENVFVITGVSYKRKANKRNIFGE